MLLADLGANVIKVESKTGDDTRQWGPPFAANKANPSLKTQESAYFLSVNRNKRSITVDIKNPKGREIIHRLAKTADVVIENYLPGKLDSMGVGYESLKKINDRLIYCAISGYGQSGPFSNKPGYDVIIEAEAGLMHITGEKEGPPVKVGVAITDLTTGLYAKGAILAALIDRSITNQGQMIDVSLMDCQVASLANIASSYLIGGQESERWGSQHSSIVPYQAFDTQDGPIVFGTGNDEQYKKFCNVMKVSSLNEEAYSTNAKRVKNRKSLIKLIQSLIIQKPRKHWLDLFESVGIPCGPVNNLAQTFAHPQVVARKMVQTVQHPISGPINLVGPAVKYSRSSPCIAKPPPTLGQHSFEILKEIGYSEIEAKELKSLGVI